MKILLFASDICCDMPHSLTFIYCISRLKVNVCIKFNVRLLTSLIFISKEQRLLERDCAKEYILKYWSSVARIFKSCNQRLCVLLLANVSDCLGKRNWYGKKMFVYITWRSNNSIYRHAGLHTIYLIFRLQNRNLFNLLLLKYYIGEHRKSNLNSFICKYVLVLTSRKSM